MLRTLLVAAVIAFGAIHSFRGPFHALLFYLWIAYFRPESWLWFDFVSQMNLSLVVGVGVVVSTLLSRDRARLGPSAWLMALLLAQSLLSTVLSPAIAYAWPFWQDFAKSTIISLIIVALVNDERRLRLTLVVIALSLGAEAAKQGWAELVLHPGAPNNNELPMLGDNNCVAVGMLMLVPVMVALARTARTRKERVLFQLLGVGTFYRGLITYSRGGFLACAAVLLHHVLRSTRRMASGAVVLAVALLILPALPDAFWDRMQTIDAAADDLDSADTSIRGRLHFWQVALDMASAQPLTGIGHNAYNAMYDRYDFSRGEFGTSRSVHSSWFGLLAELGYPGLLVFLLILGRAAHGCWTVQRMAARRPELRDLAAYAGALEAALLAFAIGGTFVPFQYTEMLWHFLALAIVVERLARQRAARDVDADGGDPVSPAPPHGQAPVRARDPRDPRDAPDSVRR